jgi:hypothetical protein
MRSTLTILSLAAVVVAGRPAAAADHLLAPETARARLGAASEKRQQDRAAVEANLSTPAAESAARLLGADLRRVRAAVATLSDAELRDLAERSAALQSDPVAGLDPDIKLLLEIFLIVAIVILVFKAID